MLVFCEFVCEREFHKHSVCVVFEDAEGERKFVMGYNINDWHVRDRCFRHEWESFQRDVSECLR